MYVDVKSGVLYLRERQANYPMLYKALHQDYYARRKGSFSLNAQFNEWTSKEKLSHESIDMNGVINNLDFQLHSRYFKNSKNQSFDISREIKSIKNNAYERDLKTGEYKELRGEGRKELELLYNSEVVHINLSHNRIAKLTPLYNLKNLKSVTLNNNEAQMDINEILKLKHLTRLEIGNIRQEHLAVLAQLINLKELQISREELNPITLLDIFQLKNLTNLERLNISGNRITSLKALENMTNMLELDISRNGVQDITPLKNMKKLQVLKASFNVIEDLSPLQNLTALREIYLDFNSVKDDTPIKQLPNLEVVRLQENPITRNARGL